MIRNVTTRARRAFRTAADAIRSTVAPASLVRSRADEQVPDPADVFTPEEMPSAEEIETAAVAGSVAAGKAISSAASVTRRDGAQRFMGSCPSPSRA